MIENDTLNTIRRRYSCRSYSPRPIPGELLEAVLDAGRYAPSGKNQQAWHFTAIVSDEARQKAVFSLGTEAPPGAPAGRWPLEPDESFRGASALVLVSCDPGAIFAETSAHVAAGYMMLAAASLGLATVWSTAFSNDMFRDEAASRYKSDLIPQGYRVYAAFFLGYPAEEDGRGPARKDEVTRIL